MPGEGREVGEMEGGGVGCRGGRESRKGRGVVVGWAGSRSVLAQGGKPFRTVSYRKTFFYNMTEYCIGASILVSIVDS